MEAASSGRLVARIMTRPNPICPHDLLDALEGRRLAFVSSAAPPPRRRGAPPAPPEPPRLDGTRGGDIGAGAGGGTHRSNHTSDDGRSCAEEDGRCPARRALPSAHSAFGALLHDGVLKKPARLMASTAAFVPFDGAGRAGRRALFEYVLTWSLAHVPSSSAPPSVHETASSGVSSCVATTTLTTSAELATLTMSSYVIASCLQRRRAPHGHRRAPARAPARAAWLTWMKMVNQPSTGPATS